MSNFKELNPSKFVYNGHEFITFARLAYGIAGYRKLDSCCEDWVLLTSSGSVKAATGAKKLARQKIVRDMAAFAVDTSSNYLSEGIDGTTWKLPDGQVVPKFIPHTTNGTSAGSTYYILANTGAGTLSYSHGDLNGKIHFRVALHADLVNKKINPWTPEDVHVSNMFPNLTFGTAEPTHMSRSTQDKPENIAMTARGFDVFLRYQGI